MNIIKRLFGGRIEGKVKSMAIVPVKKGIISEGKRIGATVISRAIVAILGRKGYSIPAEHSTEIAVAVMDFVSAVLTSWSKVTKK